jgi:hypothetical protein
VNSYRIILNKREVTGNCIRKQYVVFFGELALEEAKNLWSDRLRIE